LSLKIEVYLFIHTTKLVIKIIFHTISGKKLFFFLKMFIKANIPIAFQTKGRLRGKPIMTSFCKSAKMKDQRSLSNSVGQRPTKWCYTLALKGRKRMNNNAYALWLRRFSIQGCGRVSFPQGVALCYC
jgi:hypothetical protein